MKKPAHREGRALQVAINFESNRLSDEYLANAYELVFPLAYREFARRHTKKNSSGKSNNSTNERKVI